MHLIPQSASEITPKWLTSVLHSDTTTNQEITACTVDPIAEGIGFVSQVYRITLTYKNPTPNAPATLVAKMPSDNPQNARYWNEPGRNAHEKEIGFYKNVAPNAPIRTPHCYFAEASWEQRRSIMLFEDLSYARLSDQLQPCSAQEAEIVVRDWARFNAAFWNNDRLSQIPDLPDYMFGYDGIQARFDDAWDNYVENFKDELPPKILEIGDRITNEGGKSVRRRLSQCPTTLCHGDLRLDNFFFLDDESHISVIDWAGLRSGPGVWDISHFISQSLEPDVRESCEHSLIQIYHQTLVENGVTDYPFDQLQYDYRLSMLTHLHKLIRSFASFALVNERHAQVRQAIRRRIPAAVIANYGDDLIHTA